MSCEEFKRLYNLAVLYVLGNHTAYNPDGALPAMVEKVMAVTKGLPLYITTMSGMLIGTSVTKATLQLYLVVHHNFAADDIKAVSNSTLRELCRLAIVDNLPTDQLHELRATEPVSEQA